MTDTVYRAFFPFCGLGAGALGILRARVKLLGRETRFENAGGIDFDRLACLDFERLTGKPALCADVATLTAGEVRAYAGEQAPDLVFLSPPCKGASGLLSTAKSRSPRYQAMNELALIWTRLMFEAWPEPPRLVLVENVPRIKRRARGMVRELRKLLRAHGYVLHDGFHECGELGGLAQLRKRWLLVARHAGRVPALLYQPARRRVRGVGEVLASLPLPNDPAGGRLHVMPKLSWKNWVRLSLIPAGGDWRDLPGVLADGEERRAVFRRYHVERWGDPSVTIAGSHGPNGATAVADPRIGLGESPNRHWAKYSVGDWKKPARTVTGATRPGSGSQATNDPRVKEAYDHGYMVLRWDQPSFTVHGKSHPGCGAYSVADPRTGKGPFRGTYGVLRWEGPSHTVTGQSRVDTGSFAVADPRPGRWLIDQADGTTLTVELEAKPERVPVIIAEDGTWHRPLTTLELAALQSLPTRLPDGSPLDLAGSLTSARERIGNAVPPDAAEAISRQMLMTLVQADACAASLAGSDTPVWVDRHVAVLAC